MSTQQRTVDVLMKRHGRTWARETGIRLADRPAPLWQLLVLSLLLSARIGSGIAVAAARELLAAGLRTPRKMADATWQQRVDALGRGGYRRYDERTATMLGEAAEMLLDRYGGDLRRLREQAREAGTGQRAARRIEELLQQFKGIGPSGAAIFCREAQAVWPELAPCVDDVAADGAARLGLPRTPKRLASYVDTDDLPRLIAGCVRAARSADVVKDVKGRS